MDMLGPPEGVGLPAVRGRGHGYVARRFPYWGRRRPSAEVIERVAVIATKRIVESVCFGNGKPAFESEA
jgi:hypothetical protein